MKTVNTLESNPLCRMLGIEFPVCQAGMYSVAYGRLAAAVSRAGGLGCIGSAFMDPETLRNEIRLVKDETDRPFAVDILFARVTGDDDTVSGYTSEHASSKRLKRGWTRHARKTIGFTRPSRATGGSSRSCGVAPEPRTGRTSRLMVLVSAVTTGSAASLHWVTVHWPSLRQLSWALKLPTAACPSSQPWYSRASTACD